MVFFQTAPLATFYVVNRFIAKMFPRRVISSTVIIIFLKRNARDKSTK